MTNELPQTAKQAALELIDISEALADNMQTWGDLLAQNPESVTATMSAGFISKPSVTSEFELVIDAQTPPDEKAVLRTWAIQTKTGADHQEHSNNIQLTFATDDAQVRDLIAKGSAITRDDIRTLLQSQSSQLARITVTNDPNGERYDFTASELGPKPDDAAKVSNALHEVLQTLKQSAAGHIARCSSSRHHRTGPRLYLPG